MRQVWLLSVLNRVNFKLTLKSQLIPDDTARKRQWGQTEPQAPGPETLSITMTAYNLPSFISPNSQWSSKPYNLASTFFFQTHSMKKSPILLKQLTLCTHLFCWLSICLILLTIFSLKLISFSFHDTRPFWFSFCFLYIFPSKFTHDFNN